MTPKDVLITKLHNLKNLQIFDPEFSDEDELNKCQQELNELCKKEDKEVA